MPQDFQAFETSLRIRLRAIDSGSDAGNGTLLADATATLLAADAIAARAGPTRVAQLGYAELAHAMSTVQNVLAGDDRQGAELPLGTRATSRSPGSATVADQEYVLVAGRAGMMREEMAPMQFEGPNLDHLLRLIEQRSKRLACHRLGRPEPMTEEGRFTDHMLRFPPCEAAGGVGLQIPLGNRPLGWTTHGDLIEIADRVVRAMQVFWKSRRKVAERAVSAAETFSLVVGATKPVSNGLAVVGIVAQPFGQMDDEVPISLLVTSYDEANRPAIVQWSLSIVEQGADILRHIRCRHAWSLRCIAEQEPVEIDELAAAIVEAAPEGAASVLSRLARSVAADVYLPLAASDRTLVARVYWSCGMIVADIYAGPKIEHGSNCFTVVDGHFPETVADSLVGRTIGEIIELPMACPFPILGVERKGSRRLRLSFHTEMRRIDVEANTIGPVTTRTQPAPAA